MACFQWQPRTSPEERALRRTRRALRAANPRGTGGAGQSGGQRATWEILSNGGAVRDESNLEIISFEDDTEMTLQKHASASNKHVCEVRLKAPWSQHMFIAPSKRMSVCKYIMILPQYHFGGEK